MNDAIEKPASSTKLGALAEFRYRIRLFLQFSEEAAAKLDVQPQQHQLLLQIAGAPDGVPTTVGYAADRLGLRHNSVVELSKRCEEAGLVTRRHSDPDHRYVLLEVTPKGRRLLDALSTDHARELHELAPQLLRALSSIQAAHRKTNKQGRADES